MNFQGEIETHITLAAKDATLSEELTQWAASHGLKYVHIVLDRGQTPSQPMFTRQSVGTLESELNAAKELAKEIQSLGFQVTRIKLEVPPWSEDIPEESGHTGFIRYFEHHVKLLLPAGVDTEQLEIALQSHWARLSRNARRVRLDGQLERFVTQRIYQAGRDLARSSLERLLETIRIFNFPILEVEQEYVIYDSNLSLDNGWLYSYEPISTNASYPKTIRVLEPDKEAYRPQIFEPALRQFSHAFQLGEPTNLNVEEQAYIKAIRSEVRNHILNIISQSNLKEHLVLRGSVAMQCWFGDRAREPKDIDWVFRPEDIQLGDPKSEQFYRDLIELVRQNPTTPKTEILLSRVATDDIWTYERANGRRIVFPFRSRKGIEREIQMDIVWNETLFDTPVGVSVPLDDSTSVPLWAATAEESLCWKLIWLITDFFPQGKDLYDAVLLAEHTSLSTEFVQHVLHAIHMDEPYYSQGKSLGTILENVNVDWKNFKLDYPWITGESIDWCERLHRALKPHLETEYNARQ
jgi:predicted nucleotidyltransferase component of viral defense system